MEQHEVTHEGIGTRVGKDIARRRDEKDFCALAIEGGFDFDTRDLLDLFNEEFDHVLEGMGLNAQVVAGHITIGNRGSNPVDVETEKIEQLSADDSYFSSVNPVGAKH